MVKTPLRRRLEYGNYTAMNPRDLMLARAESYCTEHGITLAALGERVMKDNKFFKRIQNGGGFTMRTYERVMAAISPAPAEDAA